MKIHIGCRVAVFGVELIKYENHDLAIARSSSSRADPGLRVVAFKFLNV